jgi:hypothetical protein
MLAVASKGQVDIIAYVKLFKLPPVYSGFDFSVAG